MTPKDYSITRSYSDQTAPVPSIFIPSGEHYVLVQSRFGSPKTISASVSEDYWLNAFQNSVQSLLKDSIQKMEQEIVQEYSQIDQVIQIYTLGHERMHSFNVFFESQHYDPALMDRLISAEIVIMDKYPKEYFDFSYIPVFDRNDFDPGPSDYARPLIISE